MNEFETVFPAIMGSALYVFALLAVPAMLRGLMGPFSRRTGLLISLITFACATVALVAFSPSEALAGPAVPRIMGAVIGGGAAFILIRALPAAETTSKS